MPQKRNPVALEHVRILASKALGQAQGVFTSVHNTPFGDIVDCEDDLQPLIFSMTKDAIRAFRLFGGLMADAEVNVERLRTRAQADFLTVTELADTISRSEKVSFREAHELVSQAVRQLQGRYSAEAMVRTVQELSAGVLGHPLRTSEAELRLALDAGHFVEIRNIPGGPAPASVDSALRTAREQSAQASNWISSKTILLTQYPVVLRNAVNQLVNQS